MLFPLVIRHSVSSQRLLAACALVLATVGSLAPARAETPSFVVTTTADGVADDGQTSLREAITYANSLASDDTITFNVTGTITLGGTLPSVVSATTAGKLTIQGPVGGITISGNNAVRVLDVAANGSLTLNDLTISGGSSSGAGGGINNAGALVVQRCSIFNNTTSSSGYGGGGIFNLGTVTITSSTFSGNTAPNSYGGGLWNTSTTPATVTNSTFSGNTARYGGGIFTDRPITITNCTLAGNTATASGGGLYNNESGGVILRNSLIVNNSGGAIGGGYADDGGNLLAGTAANAGLEVNGNGNVVLKDNGGPTKTIALIPGGAAVDHGSNAKAVDGTGATLTTDQRGSGYSRIRNGTVDIGAYESGNLAPTDLALSSQSVAENAGDNAAIGTLSTTDPDAGDTFTYTLVTGTGDTDNAAFNISGNTLRATASFDFESKSSYSIRVRTTNAGALSFEKSFTVTVTDVNEAPADIALSNASIAENAGADYIGTFSTTDPDAGDSFTYSLVSGDGDTDNALFNLDGDALAAGVDFDFETKSSYSVLVRTTDQTGQSFEQVFTISVSNVNEAPTATAADYNVYQGTPFTTQLPGMDPDAGAVLTYNLVTGTLPLGLTLQSDGTLSGTPAASEAGVYTITYTVNDGEFTSAPAAVHVTLPDTVIPLVSITTPSTGQTMAPADFIAGFVKGAASDNVGVTGVSVKLFRNAAGGKQFWTGAGYTGTSTALAAVLTNGGGQTTGWHLDNVPDRDNLPDGAYTVVVSASDAAGNVSTAVTRNFTLASDTVAPTGTIAHPAANARLLAATFASSVVDGSAHDNVAVASVTVKLYRTIGGAKEFWTGTAWTSASVNSPIKIGGLGTTDVDWGIPSRPTEADLQAGAYAVQCQIKDASGNTATVTTPFNIVSDSSPPVVTIATPMANQHILASAFNANTVKGTATDTGGAVASISLKLYRTVSGVKYFWNGTSFGTASVSCPANVTGLGTENASWSLTPAPASSDLIAGAYSIQASAKDAAGNTSTIVTRNFTVDAPASAALKIGASGESF